MNKKDLRKSIDKNLDKIFSEIADENCSAIILVRGDALKDKSKERQMMLVEGNHNYLVESISSTLVLEPEFAELIDEGRFLAQFENLTK